MLVIKIIYCKAIDNFPKSGRHLTYIDKIYGEWFYRQQVDDNEFSSENSLPVDSVARDLATMHTICATHQLELRKQAETKVRSPC